MPVFEIQSGGKTFEVEAPNIGAAAGAIGVQAKPPGMLPDVAKSFGTGTARGLIGLAGLPGDLKAGVDWVSDRIFGPVPENIKNPFDLSPPSSPALRSAVEGVTGKFYEPKTTVGRYANSIGEMVPAVMSGPAGLMRKAGQAIGSGVASEAAGELAEGTPYESVARFAGALAGGFTPDALRKIRTPNPMSPERQRLVDILQREGVDSLTAGQKTGNKTLQYAESILGDAPLSGSRASAVQQQGQRQFTEAAMRRTGAGPDASPEVLAQNNLRLGDEFDNLSSRNNLFFDRTFYSDVLKAIRGYSKVPPSQQKAIVESYISDITDHMANRFMPGTEYQKMRSRLSSQSYRLREADPDLSQALRDLRDALDSNMARTISPADRDAWNLARRQYASQKVVENAASRAGEATAEGQIVPSSLRNAVAARNRGAYARGEGDFSELARAGSAIMAPLPNSGTGQRNQINQIVSLLSGAGIGGAAGAAATGGLFPLGLAAGAAAPGLAGRALMSRPVQNYLSNQALGPLSAATIKNAQVTRILNALVAARSNLPNSTQ